MPARLALDTTSWPKLMKKKRGTTPWQMWCLTSDDGIFHAIRNDKGTQTCNAILKNYEGVVIGDQAQTPVGSALGVRIMLLKNLEKVRPFNLQDAFPKASEFRPY